MSWLTFLTDTEVQRQPGWAELIDNLAQQRRVTRVASGEPTLWVTAERLPLFRPLFPQAANTPPVEVPETYEKDWVREDAVVEVVRGRLEGLGPTTSAAIAASLGFPVSSIESALAVLQAEGFAMRGQFTLGAAAEGEWCERRLLARIHRYTVKRLRAEIEPVEARDFLRFLFEWQRVTSEGRMEGPDAVGAILGQLEGFEAPASAWETEILPTESANTNQRGWTSSAWPDATCGRDLPDGRATRNETQHLCAAPRSSCSRDVTPASGHL